MSWYNEFPHMPIDSLRALKKGIDAGFKGFTREYGETIEMIFEPVKQFMILAEDFMLETPWPIILLLISGLVWLGSRNWKIVLGTVVTMLLIGFFDMWEDTMKTVSMTFVATLLAIVVGIPIGILMSRLKAAAASGVGPVSKRGGLPGH